MYVAFNSIFSASNVNVCLLKPIEPSFVAANEEIFSAKFEIISKLLPLNF